VKNILLIGLGNVGTHLAINLCKLTDIKLTIYTSTTKNGKEFSKRHACKRLETLEDCPSFDLALICVKDDAIPSIVSALPDSIPVAYTSGAVALEDILRKNKGVFYPLQTFQKERTINFSQVPLFIEADNASLEQALLALGKSLSTNTQIANSSFRQKLHVAAVFANNFTNFMLAQSADYLERENIPFSHLFPLLERTIENAKMEHPKNFQTGPAIRGDDKTMQTHEQLLSPEQRELYSFLSESIKNYYDKL
jgi:predicted short-subunit dehydrogenase-like oxidoreductase (DUF2520 family)